MVFDGDGMNPTVYGVLQHFRYEHLPERQQAIARRFADMAEEIAERKPDNQQTAVALQRLLEAMDAAVRAAL